MQRNVHHRVRFNLKGSMTPEQKASWALQLSENALLALILTGMEAEAVTFIVNAEPQAHDMRQAKAAELRAIRTIRDTIAAHIAISAPPRVKSIA
jgi:hypothetical protein